MKILVVGQGGREHAIIRALSQSSSVSAVYASPGRPSFKRMAEVWGLSSQNTEDLIQKSKEKQIDLVVIGPEAELVAGLSDQFRKEGFLVFGPSQKASSLEASKIASKKFMLEHNVPTAASEVVSSVEDVKRHVSKFKPPYVLKADGLAGGKGVFILKNKKELEEAATELFEKNKLGEAGRRALLEEFLPGKELSVFVLTNGNDYEILPYFRDHKKLADGDRGPNTGGMGVIGPIDLPADIAQEIEEKIVKTTILGLQKSKELYRGVIFIGVMLTEKGVSVLEYNVRFGDPEAQCIMPLLDGDWGQVLLAYAQGESLKLKWKARFSACVVLASEDYPDQPVLGAPIQGDLFFDTPNSYFLHGGVSLKNNQYCVGGGRVLNAMGLGASQSEALENAYECSKKVCWPGLQLRTDIGRS